MTDAPVLPSEAVIRAEVRLAIEEDLGGADVTAALVPADARLAANVICREDAVLAGSAWFESVFAELDRSITVEWLKQDGDALGPDDEVCLVQGPARPVLTGERTALNFLQTLSGTATRTRAYVRAIEGTGCKVLDTRKTIPGLRQAQKYAVRCGGGWNHRLGLWDAILVKENHIAAAGSITAAVEAGHERHPGLLLEVEVETLEQLAEAVEAGAERALLDNFERDRLREAVQRFGGRIQLEASGNVTLETIREVADTGVNYVSVGDITKNLRAVDFSMRFL